MSGPTRYFPHLDGLRAVAVYVVVAYHAGVGPLAGGFVGVDVFFVLSGFLITGMLVDEWRGSGRIDFGRFYARRVRRLLVAGAVAMVGAAVLFSYVSAPLERERLVGDARAGSWFVANWHFLHQAQDYFASPVDQSPFLHLWSLAVEEQFYVVWPLVLWGLLVVTRRTAHPLRWLGAVIAVVGVVSAVEAFVVADGDVLRAYYGTDTRAFQLLLGALVAVGVRSSSRLRGPGWLANAMVVVGVGAIGVLCLERVHVGAVSRGALAAAATAVVLVALQGSRVSWAARVLGWRPLALVGSLSYATYLWHWPLILVLGRVVALDGTQMAVLVAGLATAAAALSAELFEWPVRRSVGLDRVPRLTIAGGLALSGLMGAVVLPGILRADLRQINVPSATAGQAPGAVPLPVVLTPPVETRTPVPAGIPFDSFSKENQHPTVICYENALEPPNEACRFEQGPGASVLLLGDSHAMQFAETLRQLAIEHGWTLTVAARGACPWQPGLLFKNYTYSEEQGDHCLAAQARALGTLLDSVKPDVVIAIGRTFSSPNAEPMTRDPALAGASPLAMIEALTRRATSRLLEVAPKVVIMAPVAVAPVDIPTCLSAATYLEQCTFISAGPYPEEVIDRRLAAEDPRISVLDISTMLCPAFPICEPMVDGLVTRFDDDHPSSAFLMAHRDELFRRLVALGAVPAGS